MGVCVCVHIHVLLYFYPCRAGDCWTGNDIKCKLRETISPLRTVEVSGIDRINTRKNNKRWNSWLAAAVDGRNGSSCCDSRSNDVYMTTTPSEINFPREKNHTTHIRLFIYIIDIYCAPQPEPESRKMKPQTLWRFRNVVKTKIQNHQSAVDANHRRARFPWHTKACALAFSFY